ncbi:MAG: PD-(D/E)XK nuclease family protein [Actinobacteria bacterium]|nr:PD-(D/E)XK nuclease family protein [Actinomycetota bacterium]
MKISYSAVSSYQNCPLQYKFQYVDKIPSLPSPALSFGQSVHEALRWFYDIPTGDPHPLEEFLDYLEECWSGEGYSSNEEEARYFLQARSALELFYRNLGDFRIPAALERRFVVDLGFCYLSGVIDRLDKDPEGGFEIIDYKTNRRLPPAKKLHEDLQLPIYHIAVEKIWEVSPEKVTFHYLLLNHRHSMTITPERVEGALGDIKRVIECIENEAFDPRKNPLCPWCDYIGICPAWEGEIIPRKTATSPALDIGEAVDELLLAEKKVSDALSRIEGLKTLISSYLSDHGIERVGGSRGIAFIDEEGSLSWREEDS